MMAIKSSIRLLFATMMLTIYVRNIVAELQFGLDSGVTAIATSGSVSVGDKFRFRCEKTATPAAVYLPAGCLSSSATNGGYYPIPQFGVDGNYLELGTKGVMNQTEFTFESQSDTMTTEGDVVVTSYITALEPAQGSYVTCYCDPDTGTADNNKAFTVHVKTTSCAAYSYVCGNSKEACEQMGCTGDNIDCSITTSGGFGSGILHAPFKLASVLTILISIAWVVIG